jgi:hypothetical protein
MARRYGKTCSALLIGKCNIKWTVFLTHKVDIQMMLARVGPSASQVLTLALHWGVKFGNIFCRAVWSMYQWSVHIL